MVDPNIYVNTFRIQGDLFLDYLITDEIFVA